MKLLPKWCLTGTRPACYDTESLTAIQQTAKLYGAMNELIAEYNVFVDNTNKHITEYETGINQSFETFKTAIRQEFQDFIDTVDLKIAEQDSEFKSQLEELKAEMQTSINSIVNPLISDVATLKTDVAGLKTDVEGLKENAGGCCYVGKYNTKILVVNDGETFRTNWGGLYLAVVSGYESGACLISIDNSRPPEKAFEVVYTINYKSNPGTTLQAQVVVTPSCYDQTYENENVVEIRASGNSITLYQILSYY